MAAHLSTTGSLVLLHAPMPFETVILGHIRQTGISVIRTSVYGDRVNPTPCIWDCSEYHLLLLT